MVLNASDCSYLALLVCVQQHHRPAQGQLLGFPLAPHWCMGITLAKGPGLSPGMLQSWAPCKLHNEGLFKGQSLPDACRVPLNLMKSNMDCSQGLLKCQQCDKPACYLCAWPVSGLCPAVLPPAQCKAFHPWFLIPVVHLYCKASSSACKGQLIPLSCAFLATLLGGSPLLPSPWLGAQGWVSRVTLLPQGWESQQQSPHLPFSKQGTTSMGAPWLCTRGSLLPESESAGSSGAHTRDTPNVSACAAAAAGL